MKTVYVILSVFLCNIAIAQKQLPILKSNGKTIRIREGKEEIHEQHPIANAKPDIYVPKPFLKTQKITYISDIDSISFTVEKNRKYDFLIIQQAKDTIWTQINTNSDQFISYPDYKYTKTTTHKQDTIPFIIGEDSRIYLKGSINHSDTLSFLFDTGASGVVLSSPLINKKVKVKIDGSVLNVGTDGTERVPTSSKNTLHINGLTWENVPLLSIDFGESPIDAVLGWVAFQNKVLKINYESKKMIVYDSLPPISEDYRKVDFRLIDGIPYIKCKMIVNGTEYEEWFDFDSGSDGTLSISKEYFTTNNLSGRLKKLGESGSIGTTGINIVTDVLLLRRLKIADFELYNIQLSVPQKDPETPDRLGNIGNLILKRFTTIIDFRNNCMYLNPNNLIYSPMD
ncbi:retropepsin-like aspartic protease [Cellulophaga sp. BC115SP]|uniref:retropepsin-like aspartic protease n=1 Tax=Cellulophaga sp. BC115SP TaxID=2683263 RepID=UPI0014131D03|nr:retropepsin-like aspartic protease [Cellulophaga sp. BC115SP]NBB30073.1 hypothetical protein [Cellulophaga sp. BC115SP]